MSILRGLVFLDSIKCSNFKSICNRLTCELGSGSYVIWCMIKEVFNTTPNFVRREPLWEQCYSYHNFCV